MAVTVVVLLHRCGSLLGFIEYLLGMLSDSGLFLDWVLLVIWATDFLFQLFDVVSKLGGIACWLDGG